MEYRRIGKSGLRVSAVGLGGNNFGGRADEKASLDVISRALDVGINFIDTAAAYTDGHSEELVGKGVKGKRSQVIIATKFGNPRSVLPGELPGSRRHITRSVEESLMRLGTDYIDLYYFHYPDPETPIEETLRTLDGLVRSGKVRYIACSNFVGWQLADAMCTSRFNNLEPFVAVQSRYNLIDRSIEKELVPCCEAHGVGVIPWGPLASGFLTGKHERSKKIDPRTRLATPSAIYSDILTDANFDKLERLKKFAKERRHGVGELAIAWLLSRPYLGSVIAGAMNAKQLSENVKAVEWKLSAQDVAEIDKIA